MSTQPTIIRLNKTAKKKIELIAESLGYTYGSSGSISKLLTAIADNDLIVSKNFSKKDLTN